MEDATKSPGSEKDRGFKVAWIPTYFLVRVVPAP